jgi:hypothetical protein
MSDPFEWQIPRQTAPSVANGTLLQLQALLACDGRQLQLVMTLAQNARKAKMIGVDQNTGESIYQVDLDFAREVLKGNGTPWQHRYY